MYAPGDADATHPGRRRTVLILEQNEPVRRVLGRMLGLDGYEAVFVEQVDDLSSTLTRCADTLAFCLIDIPDHRGTALQWLKEESGMFRDIPFLLTSAGTAELEPADFARLSRWSFCMKPFTLAQLRACVAHLTQTHEAVRNAAG
jgi:DNA-binding NtrC family response regulator